MTLDTIIVLVIVGVPVFLGLILALFLTIGKQADAFPCPVCKQLIPIEAIMEDEVVCNHCHWELVVGADSLSDREATAHAG